VVLSLASTPAPSAPARRGRPLLPFVLVAVAVLVAGGAVYLTGKGRDERTAPEVIRTPAEARAEAATPIPTTTPGPSAAPTPTEAPTATPAAIPTATPIPTPTLAEAVIPEATPTPARPAPTAAVADPVAQSVRLLASGDKRYEAGDFAGAAADYRRSLAARPGAPAFVGLARALYDSNPANAGEALRALDGAVRLDARHAQAYLLYGVIHQDEGRKAQARAAYERFLQLQPNGPQAADVRQVLARQLR